MLTLWSTTSLYLSTEEKQEFKNTLKKLYFKPFLTSYHMLFFPEPKITVPQIGSNNPITSDADQLQEDRDTILTKILELVAGGNAKENLRRSAQTDYRQKLFNLLPMLSHPVLFSQAF